MGEETKPQDRDQLLREIGDRTYLIHRLEAEIRILEGQLVKLDCPPPNPAGT